MVKVADLLFVERRVINRLLRVFFMKKCPWICRKVHPITKGNVNSEIVVEIILIRV